jgi:hypothetical protein
MGKKSKKEKLPASSETNAIPGAPNYKPYQAPAQAKGEQNNPKVTPQVPKGAELSQQPKPKQTLPTSLTPQHPPSLKVAKPEPGTSGNSFHIPKGGDKRGRDPSQGSKTNSIIPPPSKQPRTYASAAQGRELHRVQDHQWPLLQLRVYKNTLYHEPISYEDFSVVREVMMRHSLSSLEANPDLGSAMQISSTYYNKLIHCGVYNFSHMDALNWFKQELPKACDQAFRGWTRDEQVTTFVKVFVPQGFESLSAADYLKASRLMFRSPEIPDIPWGLINESIHPTKHTRQIIASIPTVTLQVIRARGSETKAGSGVWKADGFMAPFKVTVASASDMRNANAANDAVANEDNQVANMEQEGADLVVAAETAMTSPPGTPTRSSRSSRSSSSSSSTPSQPLGPELTPSKFPGLLNDPLLSDAANTANTEEDQGDSVMDYHLLDEAGGGDWADDV